MQSRSRIAASLIRRQLNRASNSTTISAAAQRRNFSGGGRDQARVDEVTCAGIDGSAEEKGDGGGRKGESDKEYFSHHKASALSEIEVADTRKPITKATDGTGIRGGDVVGWLPEQMETAEETMMKAAEMWELNKMRGDPDAPHSRVLRALRDPGSDVGRVYVNN